MDTMRSNALPTSARLAALGVLAVASSLMLTACGSGGTSDASDPVAGTTTSAAPGGGVPSSSDPAATSSAPSVSTSSPGSDTGAQPVYFVGRTPDGSRLFREFRAVPTSDPLGGAVDLLLSGRALDPDYTTLLPHTLDITSVEQSDGQIVVHVSPDSPTSADKSVDPADARLAVQQLVYTLQGVTQTRDPLVVVQGEGAGATPTTLYGQDTVHGVAAAAQLDVLATVNVTSPAEGQSVSGTLAATGVASSFEATVPWEIRRGGPDGAVVDRGSAMASGYLDKLYPWSADIDVSGLPAGDYTFVAMTDDPSGKEGRGATEDTRSIVVQ